MASHRIRKGRGRDVCERRAAEAERELIESKKVKFMEDRVGQTFDARVTGVTRFGLFVRLAESGAEGLIPIRSLGADFFHHDEKRQALIGQRTRVSYGMGDELKVELMEAAPLTGGLRFALVDSAAGPRRAPKSRPGKSGKAPKKDRFRGKKR